MSEIAATTVHEAYAFACMRCGHGWEQAYEIEHHVDGSGNDFVIYKANGERVPSPAVQAHLHELRRPCGPDHAVRPGLDRPAAAPVAVRDRRAHRGQRTPANADGGVAASAAAPAAAEHHWHLSDLLHPFHRK